MQGKPSSNSTLNITKNGLTTAILIVPNIHLQKKHKSQKSQMAKNQSQIVMVNS